MTEEILFTLVGWVAALLALVGAVLNVYKTQWCFILWSVANTLFIALNVHHGLWSQAVLFTGYLIISIVGLVKWSQKPSHEVARENTTCSTCRLNYLCKFAWDAYNTGGDCLAEK